MNLILGKLEKELSGIKEFIGKTKEILKSITIRHLSLVLI